MDQIEEVRSKIDLVQLISEYLPLQKAGRNLKTLCPFHGEKTPSFVVSPERQIWKCFGCFPAGQFVKTPFGYHRIQDVVEGEYIFSGVGNIKKVLATHERSYVGDLISVKLSQLTEPVGLTSDHKVYVVGGAKIYSQHYKYLSKRLNFYQKYTKEKRLRLIWRYFPIQEANAGSLRKGMSLLYPVDTVVKDMEKIDLNKYVSKKWPSYGRKPLVPRLEIEVNEDLLKLIGYYVAEGSNHRAYIRFSIGNHEKEFGNEIVYLIKRIFGMDAKTFIKHKNGKTGVEITACSSVLANVFENLCGKGAENKHVPFVFQQLPKEKQLVLLNAIFKGDGYTNKISSRVKTCRQSITTISRVLSEQLTDILLRLGYYPSRRVRSERTDRDSVYHRNSFTVGWSVNPNVSKFKHYYESRDNKYFWILPVLEVSKRKFSGKVYNLTVEDDHSYIVNTFAVANCGEGGDAFSFLMKIEGMEFGEALRTLAKRAGVKLASYRPTKAESEKERLWELNHLTLEFYHYLLTSHPVGKRAMTYLLNRGINRRSIGLFNLGYAPASSDNLQRFLMNKKGYKREDLEKVGLVSKWGGQSRDFFKDRIIFPLKDHRNNVVGFAGRFIGTWRAEEASRTGPKYINIPETILYHKSELLYGLEITKNAISKNNQVVIVEGEFDLISSYQAGIENVVAIKGSALTENHLRLLKRFTENIVLALDRDLAGDAAAARGLEQAEAFSFDVLVVSIPEGKDPDELAQKDPESWKKAVQQANSIYDFYLESAFRRFDPKTVAGQRKISEELLPIFAKISNEIIKARFVRQLAQKLGISEESVVAQMKKVSINKTASLNNTLPIGKQTRQRREILEEYLITLAFQANEPKLLLEKRVGELIVTLVYRRIINSLKTFFEQEKTFESKVFIRNLPSELVEIFNNFYLYDLGRKILDKEWFTRERKVILIGLEKLDLRSRIQELSKNITQLEKEGKEEELKKAKQDFSVISKQLGNLEMEEEGVNSWYN